MHLPLLRVVSGALASLLLTGTADAVADDPLRPVPTGKTALVDNPIYKTGELEPQNCPEPPVRHVGSAKGAESYLAAILKCLDKSWTRQFAKAGLHFSTPKLKIVTRSGVDDGCGEFPEGAQAVYCGEDKTIVVLLDKAALDDADSLFLFQVIAHEYGHHVQEYTGISHAFFYWKHPTTKAFRADQRRYELQADCLSGAFIGSVRHSLDRSKEDFAYLRLLGTDSSTHGKAKNQAYWLTRGFQGKGPGACNTFAATSRVS
ncbi:neutral zinc metallopeptidase [Streptosporangium fragile]